MRGRGGGLHGAEAGRAVHLGQYEGHQQGRRGRVRDGERDFQCQRGLRGGPGRDRDGLQIELLSR